MLTPIPSPFYTSRPHASPPPHSLPPPVPQENYKTQRQELERKLRAEDRINRMRELADMRQQWLRESSLAKVRLA